jgi:hypothetical protein
MPARREGGGTAREHTARPHCETEAALCRPARRSRAHQGVVARRVRAAPAKSTQTWRRKPSPSAMSPGPTKGPDPAFRNKVPLAEAGLESTTCARIVACQHRSLISEASTVVVDATLVLLPAECLVEGAHELFLGPHQTPRPGLNATLARSTAASRSSRDQYRP